MRLLATAVMLILATAVIRTLVAPVIRLRRRSSTWADWEIGMCVSGVHTCRCAALLHVGSANYSGVWGERSRPKSAHTPTDAVAMCTVTVLRTRP